MTVHFLLGVRADVSNNKDLTEGIRVILMLISHLIGKLKADLDRLSAYSATHGHWIKECAELEWV